MGFLKKAKEAAQQAQQAFAQQGQGMVHVHGAGPIDPAIMGGPSTRSVCADDPIRQPINDYDSNKRYLESQGQPRERHSVLWRRLRRANRVDMTIDWIRTGQL